MCITCILRSKLDVILSNFIHRKTPVNQGFTGAEKSIKQTLVLCNNKMRLAYYGIKH